MGRITNATLVIVGFLAAVVVAAVLLLRPNLPQMLGLNSNLVGAHLPSALEEVADDSIYLVRGSGDGSIGRLTYELDGEGSLTVTSEIRSEVPLSVRSPGLPFITGSFVQEKVYQLSPEAANEVRNSLAQLRPEFFEGIDSDVRPVGCESQGPHDFGIMTITFVRSSEGEDYALFTLPGEDSCTSSEANQARAIVENVIASFPESEIPAQFEQAEHDAGANRFTAPNPETHPITFEGTSEEIEQLSVFARDCGFEELPRQEVAHDWERLTFPIVPAGSLSDPESAINCTFLRSRENNISVY